jgi:hypothetical protein
MVVRCRFRCPRWSDFIVLCDGILQQLLLLSFMESLTKHIAENIETILVAPSIMEKAFFPVIINYSAPAT